MSNSRALLVSALALVAIAFFLPGACAASIDVVADTYYVVDGDTIDAFPVGRIRFADIDTPESGQAGYTEAKTAVSGYTAGKRVYLDVDEVDVDDSYSRLVAVVYVRHNATHLLNVNKALVDADLAVVDDFVNEFDPATWTMYIRVPGPELPTLWEDARVELGQVQDALSTAEAEAAAALADLSEAQDERDAALSELARVSGFLNGSVPASEATWAELNATTAALAAARQDLNNTQSQLSEAQAAQAAAIAGRNSERSSFEAQLAGANASASIALLAGMATAACAGVVAFVIGRRGRGA